MATLALRADGPLLQRAGCGGTLIRPTKVITAAHCIDGLDPAKLEVHLGAAVLSHAPGTVRGIRSTATDPEYRLLPSPVAPDSPELSSATHDVAVVTLDRPVSIRPISRLSHRRVSPGTEFAVYGHGITGPPNPADPGSIRGDVLKRGVLTGIGHAKCAAATPATVDETTMSCAEDQHDTGVTACFGDSGGPLIRWQHSWPELAGVFSFAGETAGKICGTPAPAAFTDVAAVRGWLERQLQ
jgi:secreted trypsin-like serine protease